jgi:hypothetical protein
MSRERARDRPSSAPAQASVQRTVAPGRRQQVTPVQRRHAAGRPATTASGEEIQARAAEGVAGAGSPIPHLDMIRRSFGHHDVSDVGAQVGGDAARAAEDIGAQAYTTGGRVAFSRAPDLHTAAHEAAHVVQQRGGVAIEGGVGREGDAHERQADAVADRVVRGESAEALLDEMAGGPGALGAVQRLVEEDQRQTPADGKKATSGVSMYLIALAQLGIAHVKLVLHYGAGNQVEALRDTRFNSYYRLEVMRDEKYWELDESVKPIAARNPAALVAAKADLAHGGNCGEHAVVAFDFLRTVAFGQGLHLVSVEGLDHKFVLIGDMSDFDDDLVVCDPWPTRPTACLWSHHFAHDQAQSSEGESRDRSRIKVTASAIGDGQKDKAVIARGLKLSDAGKALLSRALSEKETERQITEAPGDIIWDQRSAAEEGEEFQYFVHRAPETDPAGGPTG